jgi:hypothetical protein
MRNVLFSVAAATSALAVAAPAAAQYYPAPPPVYGQGYGYQNHWGHVRALQGRVDRIQRDLGQLARYRMISRNEYFNRQQDAREIERKLRRDARDGRGISRSEVYQVERRIARLEQKIARDVRDGRRYAFRWN